MSLEILWFRSVLHNQNLTGIFCIPIAVIQKIPDPPVRVFALRKIPGVRVGFPFRGTHAFRGDLASRHPGCVCCSFIFIGDFIMETKDRASSGNPFVTVTAEDLKEARLTLTPDEAREVLAVSAFADTKNTLRPWMHGVYVVCARGARGLSSEIPPETQYSFVGAVAMSACSFGMAGSEALRGAVTSPAPFPLTLVRVTPTGLEYLKAFLKGKGTPDLVVATSAAGSLSADGAINMNMRLLELIKMYTAPVAAEAVNPVTVDPLKLASVVRAAKTLSASTRTDHVLLTVTPTDTQPGTRLSWHLTVNRGGDVVGELTGVLMGLREQPAQS